jgi:hypothetical protein
MKRKLLTTASIAVLLIMAGSLASCESIENPSKLDNIVEVKIMMGDIELSRINWKGTDFTTALPETVNPNYLLALIDNRGLPTTRIINSSTATISNKNAKIADIHFLGVDKNNNRIVAFHPVIVDENGCQISMKYDRIHLRYVDTNVTVSGYVEHTYGSHNMTNIFSIKWKKGWNVLWISDFSAQAGRPAAKWLTIPINRLKWNAVEWRYPEKDI